jgi:hypothetical protein
MSRAHHGTAGQGNTNVIQATLPRSSCPLITLVLLLRSSSRHSSKVFQRKIANMLYATLIASDHQWRAYVGFVAVCLVYSVQPIP